VHFGHSCLSFVDKVPVFYVFEKSALNLDSVKNEIELLLEKNEQPINKLIVLYDVCYYYLYGNDSILINAFPLSLIRGVPVLKALIA